MGRGEGRARGGSSGGARPTSGPGEELAATETVACILEAASEALRQLRSAQQQADRLVRQAMEPAWEARLSPHTYGFRPGRSCWDAIEALFNSIRFRPQ